MTTAYYDDPNYLYGDTNRYYDDQPSDFDQDRLIWRFEVAWIGGMNFFSEDDGTTEASITIDCSWSRGRQRFVNYDSAGLERFAPGRMTITLIDRTGRYDPRNTSSPLYGYIEPGKFCRLNVRLNESLTHKHRFSGIILDITSRDSEEGEKLVDISVVCGWGFLQDHDVYFAAAANANPAACLPNVLSASEWPEVWGSTMDDGPALLPFFWSDGKDARTVLHDVADTLASRAFITGDGKFHWTSRVNPEPVPAAYLIQSDLLKVIPVNNPWDYKFDLVEVMAKSVGPTSGEGTIWGDTMSLNPLPYISTEQVPDFIIRAGGTTRINGSYSLPSNLSFPSNGQFLVCYSPSFPSAKVEFRFLSVENFIMNDFIEVLEFKDCGTAFFAILKNNYQVDAQLQTMTVVNQAYEYLNQGVIHFSRSVPNATKRLKRFSLSNDYLINYSHMVSHISTLVAWYFGLLTTQWMLPIITLESQPELQFVDIMDVIDLEVAAKSIDDTFRVGYIDERWLSPNAQAVQTIIHMEPSYG